MNATVTEQDTKIRLSFNVCMACGMATYTALQQVAAVYGITAKEVKASLELTNWETSPRD